MTRVCLCLTGKTLEQNRELLAKYRRFIDLAELRVDCLDPDERFLIRRFPGMCEVPVILTIRRQQDGGCFVGGEGARITLFSTGLAFAEVDRRQNFAYVDLEEDFKVPSLEEAARAFGTRIIRSCHDFQGARGNLVQKLRSMGRGEDEIVKLAVLPRSLEEVVRLYEAAREVRDREKIVLCMGDYGLNTRILAGLMGSFLSYTSGKEEGLPPAGAGQLDPQELVEGYRFRELTPSTRLFGIVGFPLKVTSSPAFFNAVFTRQHRDAVYVPFPSDSIGSFMKLAELLALEGASVTIPYKEEVLPYLNSHSEAVGRIGACNTIVRRTGHEGRTCWEGFNTDAPGFSDSLLDFIGEKSLRGKRAAIIGAGGAARAVAAEVYRLKGKALILNRTLVRARDLAAPYRFEWAGLDGQGVARICHYGDLIVQTSSVGMEPSIDEDPLELYQFSGQEAVMDLIYKPEATRFLKRAASAGCATLNGRDMLLRQAQYQYAHFFGEPFPSELLSRLQFS